MVAIIWCIVKCGLEIKISNKMFIAFRSVRMLFFTFVCEDFGCENYYIAIEAAFVYLACVLCVFSIHISRG